MFWQSKTHTHTQTDEANNANVKKARRRAPRIQSTPARRRLPRNLAIVPQSSAFAAPRGEGLRDFLSRGEGDLRRGEGDRRRGEGERRRSRDRSRDRSRPPRSSFTRIMLLPRENAPVNSESSSFRIAYFMSSSLPYSTTPVPTNRHRNKYFTLK
jgi:hypothetical protein